MDEAEPLPGFLRTRRALRVDPSSMDFTALADQVAKALSAPGDTIDPDNLARGQEARRQALETLKSYSRDLEQEDVKRAGLRALKT
jgi:hypothetical protein